MRLPFGLDLKSIIVTLAFVYFVIPWVMGFMASRSNSSKQG